MLCSCRKIRPCPSTNPGCVSTNPKSSSFAFPWRIPENSTDNAVQVLRISVCVCVCAHCRHFDWISKVALNDTCLVEHHLLTLFCLFSLSVLDVKLYLFRIFCRNCKKQSWKHRKMRKFRLWKIHQMVTRLSSNISLGTNWWYWKWGIKKGRGIDIMNQFWLFSFLFLHEFGRMPWTKKVDGKCYK